MAKDALGAELKQTILSQAKELYDTNPKWDVFHNQILGLGGVIRKLIPDPADVRDFEQSETYQIILEMVFQLRNGDRQMPKGDVGVITVRLPKSVHSALIAEAHEHHMSMNKMCVEKLLQPFRRYQVTE